MRSPKKIHWLASLGVVTCANAIRDDIFDREPSCDAALGLDLVLVYVAINAGR